MTDLPVSIYCPYCKQHTALTPAPIEVTYEVLYSTYKKTVGAIWKRSYNDIWWIGVCNYCKNPVLIHNHGDIIYPHPLPSPTDERIPAHIRKDIDEAKLCFSVNTFRACVVMARRAIQNACIDKGADKNKRLEKQIEELADKGVITNHLKEWANVVRWVGNDAAHPDKNEVIKEDAKDILQLAEQFMHVIYVAPAIAKEQRKRRGK